MKSELLAGLQVRACATEVRAEPTPVEEVLDRVLAPIYLRQLVGYKRLHAAANSSSTNYLPPAETEDARRS